MTSTADSNFFEEMKKIASMQPSGSREQDRNNARDAWKATNTGIRKKKINKKVDKKVDKKKVDKKKVEMKKVEKKKVEKQAEVEDVHPPRAPT